VHAVPRREVALLCEGIFESLERFDERRAQRRGAGAPDTI
jgi:hypothetical protein